MQVREKYIKDLFSTIDTRENLFRIRHDQRGGAREARCECNDQVEMCG